MEKFPQRRTPATESARREAVRENIFAHLVAQRILESFDEKMHEGGLDPETIQEAKERFAILSEEDKKAVLAVPSQLQTNLFSKYAERVDTEEIDGTGIIDDLLKKSHQYGFTLGYHLSPQEIRPDKNGEWIVRGTEKDHRHDDVPMAYYSMDYAHRYLKKPMQWLYVVRAETRDQSGHHRDNNGAWGHAPSLSIIEAIDMFDLEKQMDTELNRVEQEKKEKEAA